MKGKKDFLVSGTIYTVLGFLPTASRFILFPLFLHYLTPDDFALIGLNTMVASILPTFMSFGLETSMNRFYFDFFKFPKIEKAFLSTLIISIICFSLFLGIIFIFVGPHLFAWSFKSPRFKFYPFGFSALLTALPGGLYSLYLTYLRCRKDLQNYVILNLGLFLCTSIGEIVGIVFLKLPVEQLVWIRPMIIWPFVAISTALFLWESGVRFEMRLLRIGLSYSTPLLPHLIFNLVFIYADRIIIENNNAYMLVNLAIYNLTMAISNIIDIFEQALRNATFPNIYRLLKENVYTNVEAVSRIHVINGLLLMIIMSGVALMTPVGVYYFLKPAYRPLIYLVPFALIISVIRYYYIVYVEPLFFFKKVKHVSFSTFLQGSFSIALNLLLIPRFGLLGALTANIISKCIQVSFIYYISVNIKVFQYKVGFILSAMVVLLILFFSVSMISRQADNHILIHLAAAAPIVFTTGVALYYARKNHLSLKQLW